MVENVVLGEDDFVLCFFIAQFTERFDEMALVKEKHMP